jgi:hypothetical protein
MTKKNETETSLGGGKSHNQDAYLCLWTFSVTGVDLLPVHIYKLTLCYQAIKTVKGVVEVSVPL